MNEAFFTEGPSMGKRRKFQFILIFDQKSQNELKALDKILQIYPVNILYVLTTTGEQNDIQNQRNLSANTLLKGFYFVWFGFLN